MKGFFKALVALVLLTSAVPAHAQSVNLFCTTSTVPPYLWVPCSFADTTVTGAVAATSGVVTIPTSGKSTVGLSVTGTWSGSLTIRASVDYASVGAANATWGTTTAIALSSGAITSAITGNGIYQINASGFSAIQAFGTSIVSGTANAVLIASSSIATVMADNPLPIVINPYTPAAPATSNAGKIATGGTAQNLFTAAEVVHGCVITNPGNATDQGISTAEEIWVNFVTTATAAANSASIPVAIGQSIPCPGGLTTAVSWIAATSSHVISAYKY
jgi:hypothetical protein